MTSSRMYPQAVADPQVVFSTAHPTKFSEMVPYALRIPSHFNFERDVLPDEFRGLLEKEKELDVDKPEVDLSQGSHRKVYMIQRKISDLRYTKISMLI
jgi:threonine synthase